MFLRDNRKQQGVIFFNETGTLFVYMSEKKIECMSTISPPLTSILIDLGIIGINRD